jgi:hypothetical protein
VREGTAGLPGASYHSTKKRVWMCVGTADIIVKYSHDWGCMDEMWTYPWYFVWLEHGRARDEEAQPQRLRTTYKTGSASQPQHEPLLWCGR